MGSDLVIISRTDALGARLIDSNIDPIDQPHILGRCQPDLKEKLVTFPEAGYHKIEKNFA